MYQNNGGSRVTKMYDDCVTMNNGRNLRQNITTYQHPLQSLSIKKLQNEHKNPVLYSTVQLKTPTTRARDSVKFDEKILTRNNRQNEEHNIHSYNNSLLYTAQNKELYDQLANDESYNSCIESEMDSVYSSSAYHDDENESDFESLYDQDEYTRKALRRMESKVNTFTDRFVKKVRSEVDETFSKLKIQTKMNSTKVRKVKKEEESGDGSKKSTTNVDNDAMIKKMLKVKLECYKKIDNTLRILQNVDRLTEELYKNHMSTTNKKP